MHGTPVTYFKSLNRPFTVLGVDRSLFYLFVAMGLAIAFSARLSWVMDGVAGINEYETDRFPQIPSQRQVTVNELRARLDQRQAEQLDSLAFREEMVTYMAAMPVSHFLFISFESRLRKKLQAVLDEKRFSVNQLSIAERTEIRQHHQIETQRLTGEVNDLRQQLADALAKDNVQLVNQLQLALTHEKEENKLLVEENTKLQTSMNQLKTKYKQLKTENAKLVTENTHLKAESEVQLCEKSASSIPHQNSALPTAGFV